MTLQTVGQASGLVIDLLRLDPVAFAAIELDLGDLLGGGRRGTTAMKGRPRSRAK
jgi:hypothetical protein